MEEIYEASLEVRSDFGEIGAVIVEHHNEKEMFIKEVHLNGLTSGPLNISCNSWVQPKTLVPTQKRVFFTNKVMLNPFLNRSNFNSMIVLNLFYFPL